MILALDVGNSSTHIGLLEEDGALAFCGSLATERTRTTSQWAIDLMGLFHLHGASCTEVTGAIISSVVPPVTAPLSRAVQTVTGQAPMLVGPGIRTGLNIKTDSRNQLGADIVVSSVAALNKYPSPVILVDMGTATTLSMLIDTTYEGCAIIPGVQVAMDALSSRAAALPYISIAEHAPQLLGRNTDDAMRAGILHGSAAMIDGLIERLEQEYGPAAAVVATGEISPLILDYCHRKICYDENLIMDGLYLIYRKNTDRNRR